MIICNFIVIICGILRGVIAIANHECTLDLWCWCFIASGWTFIVMLKKS